MKVLAPAKINLFLSVGARRDDGLHELVSVMQAVSLADIVTISPAAAFEIAVHPEGAAPADASNLAIRAASVLAAMRGVEERVRVELDKRIPAGAGLAGGSADAAAVLVGLREGWALPISRKALEKIAAGLGSDVPFCVRGGTAAVYGGGESLSSLPCPTPIWWAIGVPRGSLSTAEVYAEFDRLGGGDVGDPYEVADALARGDVDRLGAALRNDLEAAARSLDPSIDEGRDAMASAGAVSVCLTGSGPAWLALARDEGHAREIAARAAPAFERVEVCSSLSHGPRVLEG